MSDDQAQDGPGTTNPAYVAVVRTLTRGAALYFSRPVRLFRPSKISGWQSLRGLAARNGTSLSHGFITQLVKTQGILVFSKHFVPPLLVNATLGTVLWTTYSESSSILSNLTVHPSPITIAAISGAVAGGAQAIVAAPAENVRLVIEGGAAGGGWSHAWKEMLRGATPNHPTEKDSLRRIRQVRSWMAEVRDMAGRGWNGWGWGLAKDVCGFSVFFAIFEVTRHVAIELKVFSLGLVQPFKVTDNRPMTVQRHLPRVVHGVTLVAGGVTAGLAYELVCRPWDVARKLAYLDRIQSATTHRPRRIFFNILARKIHEDGILSFFRNPAGEGETVLSSPRRQRLLAVARTLGRVGPWGVGFLVWEAFGPGIS